MVNHHKGEVEILIDGATRVAKFDFNAIMCLETHFGSREDPKPLQEIFKAGKSVPSSLVPVVIWACLNSNHAEDYPTVRHLAAALDLSELAYYSEQVTALMRFSQESMSSKRGAGRPTPAVLAPAREAAEPSALGTTGTASDDLPGRLA